METLAQLVLEQESARIVTFRKRGGTALRVATARTHAHVRTLGYAFATEWRGMSVSEARAILGLSHETASMTADEAKAIYATIA